MGTSKTLIAPAVQIPAGCETRELPFKIGSGRTLASQSFGSNANAASSSSSTTSSSSASAVSDEGEKRIRLRVFFRPSDGYLVGKVWFGDGSEGPPGHVHGGASAYVLDEAMGSVGWMNQLPILAAHLDFDYLRPTPLYHDLTIEAWLGATSGRRVAIHSRLLLDGAICVQGRGDFAIIPRSKISALASENDPQVQAINANPLIRWASE